MVPWRPLKTDSTVSPLVLIWHVLTGPHFLASTDFTRPRGEKLWQVTDGHRWTIEAPPMAHCGSLWSEVIVLVRIRTGKETGYFWNDCAAAMLPYLTHQTGTSFLNITSDFILVLISLFNSRPRFSFFYSHRWACKIFQNDEFENFLEFFSWVKNFSPPMTIDVPSMSIGGTAYSEAEIQFTDGNGWSIGGHRCVAVGSHPG